MKTRTEFTITPFVLVTMVALGSAVSPDGTCGSSSAENQTCAQDLCCSQFGWCGTTVDFCGSGCQWGYGRCGAAPGLEMLSCVDHGKYALTFDDGPTDLTPDVILTLNSLFVKATFFVLGKNLEDTPENELLRSYFLTAYYSGHLVASHSFSHAFFPNLTMPQMKEELQRTSDLFKELIGWRPRYFRAPSGGTNEEVISLLKELGYNLIKWNMDSRDWENGNESVILSNVEGALNSASPKDKSWIDVNHDRVPATVNSVEKIVNLIWSKGYSIVPLTDCVGDHQHPYIT